MHEYFFEPLILTNKLYLLHPWSIRVYDDSQQVKIVT